jgi:hypothetical protein
MIKMPLSVVRVVAFCLPLALVASCGSGSGAEAVQDTTMNLDPEAIGQATTLGYFGSSGNVYRVEPRSPTGYPQVGVRVLIDSQYTVYAGHPTVVCTAVDDGGTPPVFLGTTCTAPSATPLDLPYETTTDTNGTYEVTVIYSWGVGINGTFTALQAWSGTGYGISNITFTCSDPDTDDALECP